MSNAYRLVRNIFYNFLSQAWFVVIGFAATPYIVRKLGNDAYGILALVSALMGYFAFLNFGFGPAVIKYASEYHAKNDADGMSRLMGTALSFFLLVGAVGAALIFSCTPLIVSALPSGSPEMAFEMRLVLRISAAGFLLNMPLSVFSSVPRAMQRFDISNRVDMLLGTITIGATLLALYLGGRIVSLAVLNAAMSAAGIAVFIGVSRALMPGISFRPAFDRRMFRDLSRYGGAILLTQVTGNIIFQLDKLIIGIFQPIAALTFYSVPFNLSQKLLTFPSILTPAVFPAASEKQALEKHGQVEEIYLRGSKLVAALVIPAAVVTACYAPQLMLYWLGPEFAQKSSLPLRFLAATFSLAALTTVPTTVAQAVGRPGFPAKAALFLAGLQILLVFGLVPKFGVNGAAVSIFVAHAVFVPAYIYAVHLKISTGDFSYAMRRVFVRPAFLGLFALGLCMSAAPVVRGLPELIAVSLIIGVVCLAAGYAAVLDPQEKALLRGYFLRAGGKA